LVVDFVADHRTGDAAQGIIGTHSGREETRATANALTTADAAATLTSKLRANRGSAGTRTPYPIAIMNVAKTGTPTSRGSRFRTRGIVLPCPAMVQ
jgi:hypothetical protein